MGIGRRDIAHKGRDWGGKLARTGFQALLGLAADKLDSKLRGGGKISDLVRNVGGALGDRAIDHADRWASGKIDARWKQESGTSSTAPKNPSLGTSVIAEPTVATLNSRVRPGASLAQTRGVGVAEANGVDQLAPHYGWTGTGLEASGQAGGQQTAAAASLVMRRRAHRRSQMPGWGGGGVYNLGAAPQSKRPSDGMIFTSDVVHGPGGRQMGRAELYDLQHAQREAFQKNPNWAPGQEPAVLARRRHGGGRVGKKRQRRKRAPKRR